MIERDGERGQGRREETPGVGGGWDPTRVPFLYGNGGIGLQHEVTTDLGVKKEPWVYHRGG